MASFGELIWLHTVLFFLLFLSSPHPLPVPAFPSSLPHFLSLYSSSSSSSSFPSLLLFLFLLSLPSQLLHFFCYSLLSSFTFLLIFLLLLLFLSPLPTFSSSFFSFPSPLHLHVSPLPFPHSSSSLCLSSSHLSSSSCSISYSCPSFAFVVLIPKPCGNRVSSTPLTVSKAEHKSEIKASCLSFLCDNLSAVTEQIDIAKFSSAAEFFSCQHQCSCSISCKPIAFLPDFTVIEIANASGGGGIPIL